MAIDGGPVIASSNRFTDILPYSKLLHEEDHQRWGGTMPWNFPQNAGKEEEDAFLLKEFGESECHMQGFKFLKQVWYCIAINNFENRIPLVVTGWFEQKSHEYLNDPAFEVHLLNENARAQTFFENSEIDLYGAAFLDVAVKCIQYRIRHPQEFTASPSGTRTAPVAVASDSNGLDTAVGNSDGVANTGGVVADDPPIQSPKDPKPTLAVSSTVLKPTATVFNSSNTPVQATAFEFEPSFNARNFGDESNPSQSHYQHGRKRASHGKRSSYNDRAVIQPGHGAYDPGHPPSHVQQGQPPRHTQGLYTATVPIPQFATRGPSKFSLAAPGDYRLPFSPGSGPPPSAYSGAQIPPGLEHYPRQLPGDVPTIFMPRPPPLHGYGNSPLSERNMNHGEARNVVGQPGARSYGRIPEQSRGKRRDSTASYGSRGGSYSGSTRGRGRGGRGRNSVGTGSIDEEYHSGYRHPSSGYSDQSEFGKLYEDRLFSGSNRNTENHGSWRSRKQDENMGPARHHFEQYPHGPPQILHNPGRVSQPHAVPAMMQHPIHKTLATSAEEHRPVLGYLDRGHQLAHGVGHPDVPIEEYHCSKSKIGEKCLYANKVIAFTVPRDTPDHVIRQCFEQFGSVTQVSQAKAMDKPADPHRFITFSAAAGARACVKTGMVVICDKEITVEVAREFWDPEHFLFKPRPQYGVLLEDLNKVVPPSMHYGQGSAMYSLLAPPANAIGYQDFMPRNMDMISATLTKDTMSSDTTPNGSRPGTPKGKKTGRKNKKKASTLREDRIRLGAEEISQLTRSGLSPVPDDSSSTAETVVTPIGTKHTTPMRRNDSLPPGSGDGLTSAQRAPPSKNGDAAPVPQETSISAEQSSRPNLEPQTSTENSDNSAASPEILRAEVRSSTEVAEKTTDLDNKSEDEPIDDSFHTASATPSEERVTIGDMAVMNSDADVQARPSPVPPIDTVLQVGTELSDIEPKSAAVAEPVKKDEKKVLLPALPRTKSKVSIAVPEIDTIKAEAHADSGDQSGEGALDAAPQRTVSSSSEVASANFVTAPNTPALPVVGTIDDQVVLSKKEANAKEEAKAKGPAQTESLSLFGKTRKSRKSKGGTGNSRVNSRISSAELPKPDELPVRKVTDMAKSIAITEQSEPAKEGIVPPVADFGESEKVAAVGTASGHPADAAVSAITMESVHNELDKAGSALAQAASSSTSDGAETFHLVNAPSPRGPGYSLMRRLTGMFAANPDISISTETEGVDGLGIQAEPANEVTSKNVEIPQELDYVKDHSGTTPSKTAAVETLSKKSKNKKKSKKKAATIDASEPPTDDGEFTANQSKVMVLEMSHLAPSNEVSTPLYDFHSTDTGTMASSPAAAVFEKNDDQSPPAKVKLSRRLIPDSHLVQAPPVRRVPSRAKHGVAKKSSDSSDSRVESTLSTGQVQQQSVSSLGEGTTAGHNNVCTMVTLPPGHVLQDLEVVENNDEQGQPQKLLIIITSIDPVEKSKIMMKGLEDREREIKQKNMEMGMIVGEVIEDEDEEIKEDVKPME